MRNSTFFSVLSLFVSVLSWNNVFAGQEVTVLFTSALADVQMESGSAGLPQLASLLKKVRSEREHVIFLHGGGALSPSILSSTDRGAHMIAILNMLKPDGMAIAKNEFAHKEDELSKRAFEASFPLIISNIDDPLTAGNFEGTHPYRIIKAGDYTIGVLALVDPDVIEDYIPKRAVLKSTASTIKDTAAALRDEGADIIFLMTDFRPPRIDDFLTDGTVDIVLVSDPSLSSELQQEKSNYFEINTQARTACIFSLQLNGHGKDFSWTGRTDVLQLAEQVEAPEVREKISSFLDQLETILAAPVGRTRTPIDTSRAALRACENGFASMLADILREFYQADFGLINGGGIRGNRTYPAGTMLTRADIHREIPFNNRIVNIEVTGRQMLEALENGFSRYEEAKGRFPHVSGMQVIYDTRKEPGKRVIRVLVNGSDLQLEKTYSLATVDYIAQGGDGYIGFRSCRKLEKIGGGRLLWEYVRNGIVSRGEIAPRNDGRMKNLAATGL